MSSDGADGADGDVKKIHLQPLIETLSVKAVEVEKRFAHDLTNAVTQRRQKIRQIVDEVAGDIPNEAQEN